MERPLHQRPATAKRLTTERGSANDACCPGRTPPWRLPLAVAVHGNIGFLLHLGLDADSIRPIPSFNSFLRLFIQHRTGHGSSKPWHLSSRPRSPRSTSSWLGTSNPVSSAREKARRHYYCLQGNRGSCTYVRHTKLTNPSIQITSQDGRVHHGLRPWGRLGLGQERGRGGPDHVRSPPVRVDETCVMRCGGNE